MRQARVVQADIGQPKRGERFIGAILMEAGRLTPQDADRILGLQREQGLRFGDAGKQLGLLTESDVAFALSRQFDYPYLVRGESELSEDLVAAYHPFSPQVEPLRALRDQLVQRWFDADRKALALVGGGRSEGRSFVAANLAVVFAQLGARTLLVDADMRNPSQHRLFGLDNRVGLSALLSERCGAEAAQRVPGLNHLSVLPAGARPPNPSELLGRPLFAHCFHELKRDFDVILFDTPAATESGDAQAVSIRVGAALIVARKNSTRMWHVRALADNSSQVSVTVIGAVLNEF